MPKVRHPKLVNVFGNVVLICLVVKFATFARCQESLFPHSLLPNSLSLQTVGMSYPLVQYIYWKVTSKSFFPILYFGPFLSWVWLPQLEDLDSQFSDRPALKWPYKAILFCIMLMPFSPLLQRSNSDKVLCLGSEGQWAAYIRCRCTPLDCLTSCHSFFNLVSKLGSLPSTSISVSGLLLLEVWRSRVLLTIVSECWVDIDIYK